MNGTLTSERLFEAVNEKTGYLGCGLQVAVVLGLLLAALALQRSGIADVIASYVFVAAVLGILFPFQLLEIYLFFLAFLHRDFTYLSLSIFGAPLYISEWVLFILLIASLLKKGIWVRAYPYAMGALAVYVGFGGMMLFIQPFWGLGPMLRDFVIVYYALFIIPVLAHVEGKDAIRRLFAFAAAGAAFNLIGEFLNCLYGTFPWTAEQKNHSLRSSFYYLAVAAFFLPALPAASGVRRGLIALAFGILWFVVFYYAYSKTAMVAFVVIGILFLFMNRFRKFRIALIFATMIILPMLIIPSGKTFTFSDAIWASKSAAGTRPMLNRFGLRDFTQYPYGIGFGSPIFGPNSQTLKLDLETVKALHNSYLTLLRRMGIAGIVAFILLVGSALFTSFRGWRTSPVNSTDSRFYTGLILSFVSAAIFCYSHVALEGPFFGVFFWCLIGCLFVAGRGDYLRRNV